ncbi:MULTISPECIES: hypothetical protein [unclassified Nostoc]|uniref:hypothetical protein n=1 Tax=unclassified Nostoc TaxID=2593658 RepID=UPI0025AA6B58|nr:MULTISPECIES: hypothetical protein [unclassified Nostoc]MDM9582572.1 hypothetical protein [Nostoc sp. GT001]MDZ7943882.1 hypothetical protein [Nostoc sp. EfeVER01]MDZ7992237.1 hypothetical protein [Nostoc sp. EspVER01]
MSKLIIKTGGNKSYQNFVSIVSVYSHQEGWVVIRDHWSIENQLHWVKDVTLNEDNCIHTGGFSPANWAMVRQFLASWLTAPIAPIVEYSDAAYKPRYYHRGV